MHLHLNHNGATQYQSLEAEQYKLSGEDFEILFGSRRARALTLQTETPEVIDDHR